MISGETWQDASCESVVFVIGGTKLRRKSTVLATTNGRNNKCGWDWLGMDGFLRNSHGATRASSSKTALFSLESDCSECTLILPNVEVDTVVFFDPSWRRLRIFFADLATLLILLIFRWVRYSSPLLHRLTTCNQYWIILNTPHRCNALQNAILWYYIMTLFILFLVWNLSFGNKFKQRCP